MKTPQHIEGSEKVIEVLGHWPCFHDAEVISFSADRAIPIRRGSTVAKLAVHVREHKAIGEGTVDYKIVTTMKEVLIDVLAAKFQYLKEREMSKKLISVLTAIVMLVFGVTAFAAETPAGSKLSPNVQKLPTVNGPNPALINPAVAQVKPVVVEVNKVIGVVGEQKIITVTVKSADGAPVKRGDVMLKINGTYLEVLFFGTVATGAPAAAAGTVPFPTDDNGILSIPIVPRPDKDKILRMGVNTIEAEFTGKTATGTNKYKPGKAMGTLSILKGVTRIVPIDKNALCLTYQANPSSCQGLAQRNVIVMSKGKQIANLMTEKQGSATYDGRLVISSQFGQYSSCQIVFQGDEFFLPATFDKTPCWAK